jgi:outer membrane lipoprotein-sorting protein
MRVLRTVAIATLFLMGVVSLPAQSVDEIIAKYVVARGGENKIKAINSERLVGRISLNLGGDGPLTLQLQRPNKIRQEFQLNNQRFVRVSNGTEGWSISPMVANGDAQSLSQNELQDLRLTNDIEGPLLGYQSKGNKIELVGRDKVQQKDAFKLKVMLASGKVRYDYIDAESFLEVKQELTIMSQGREFATVATFHNFRNVGGVIFPFQIETEVPAAGVKQKITFDTIQINPSLDAAIFEKLKNK